MRIDDVTLDDVALLVERQPIPGAGHSANTSNFLRDFLVMLSRVSLGVRQADGSYRVIAPSDVALSEEDVRRMVVQHQSAPPEGLRSMLYVLASPAHGRSIARQRGRDVRPPAQRSPSEAARLTGVDLVRQENEARQRLAAVKAAQEKHSHLVDAGDTAAAAEIKP